MLIWRMVRYPSSLYKYSYVERCENLLWEGTGGPKAKIIKKKYKRGGKKDDKA